MAKTNKPNGTRSTKSPEQDDASTLVPTDAAPVAPSARILTVPANIVTGYIMYANSHYYYSLDCCVTGDRHTSVLVTTTAQVVYSCEDPERKEIEFTGTIEENFIARNYAFAAFHPSSTSAVSPATAGPSIPLTRLATVSINPKTANGSLDVPPQLLSKAYGLFEVKFDGRTYVFLVYERAATRFDLEAQFIDLPQISGPIFLGELSVARNNYVVRGVEHD